MFWDKWIPKKYHYKQEVCAVKVTFLENGINYNYVKLKNKNNKLSLDGYSSNQEQLELPESVEKNKIPVVIIINGKGIVIKKVEWNDDSEKSEDEIIQSNLPAINAAEFYIQLYKQGNNTGYITLCRRDQIDNTLHEFKSKKLEIASVDIGVPVVMGLQPVWQNYNTINTTYYSIQLTNNAIDAISTRKDADNLQFKVDDISLNPENVIGFAAGLAYFTQQQFLYNANVELASLLTQQVEKNKFRFLQIVVVALALIVSFGNVLIYTNYFTKNNKIETELNVYQGKYEQINTLLNDYQKKKDLIENAGVLSKNKLSEYADKIAGTIPNEVALTELYFNPEIDNEEDSLLTFNKNNIVLKGNCNKSLIINEWANVLKMQKFIKDVALEKFNYNNEGLLPNFEIRIETH